MSKKQPPRESSPHTVDLSSGKKGKAKKKPKGFAPVVQQTINLSTPKEEVVEPIPQPQMEGAPAKRAKKENRKPRSQGNSLADLIDPETLAKLRG